MVQHLSIRVPWHDNGWDGTVCQDPCGNTACLKLNRILEVVENIAFVMAKHADASIPNTLEEWLDGFNTFSIYQVLPQLIELWGLNVQTDVEAKKTSSDRP